MIRTLIFAAIGAALGAIGALLVWPTTPATPTPQTAQTPAAVETTAPPSPPPTPSEPPPTTTQQEPWPAAFEDMRAHLVSVPEDDLPQAGTGILGGEVSDSFDRPIVGALVSVAPVYPEELPRREYSPENLWVTLVQHRWHQLTQRTTRTAEDGSFTFENLPDAEGYTCIVTREGYTFESRYARVFAPGNTVYMRGTPIVDLRIRAVFPDGRDADAFEVEFGYRDDFRYAKSLPAASPGVYRCQRSDEEELVRVRTPGFLWVSEAQTVPLPEALPAAPVDVTFVLRPRTESVFIALNREPEGVHPPEDWVRLFRVPDDRPLDELSWRDLPEVQTIWEDLEAYENQWEVVYDVPEPGRYLVAVMAQGIYGTWAHAWQAFQVTPDAEAATVVQLPVPSLPAEELLIVHTPTAPANAPMEFSASWHQTGTTIRLDWERVAVVLGRRCLELDDAEVGVVFPFDNHPWPEVRMTFPATAIPADLALNPTAEVKLPQTIRLTDMPTGFPVHLLYLRLIGRDGQGSVYLRSDGQGGWSKDDVPQGRFWLAVEYWNVRLMTAAIVVTPESDIQTLPMPPLYDLTVLFPPGVGTDGTLAQTISNLRFRDERAFHIIDNRATFRFLPAGRYRLQCGTQSTQRMDITLAGDATVTFPGE